MKNLKQFLAAAAMVTGTSVPAAALHVQTHTAADAGFVVNSHLISGKRDAILVDAQFTRSEARKVSQMIRQSGKRLTTIFITHGHPDHYFGLEILAHDFPQAKILATREVIGDIQATAAGKIAYWKPIYKDDLTDSVRVPEELKTGELELEGERLPVLELGPGESEHAAAVYIPSLRTLVAGDLAFNQVHLWLAENRPESWLANLREVREGSLVPGPVERVLPGHGLPGTARILDADREYIETFLKITGEAKTSDEALASLKQRYSQFRLPVIAELSVKARTH